MTALAVSGSLLAIVVAVWLIALNLDATLHAIFGGPTKPPRRHRPY